MRGDQWNRHYYRKHPPLPNCELCGIEQQSRVIDPVTGASYQCRGRLGWDHCHSHNIVRGTLCGGCNVEEAVALRHDDPSIRGRYAKWWLRCPECAREREEPGPVKRCQVCGNEFDPDAPGGWACSVAFKGRHLPIDRPGCIYILHFDEPTHVQESDRGHVQPTTHYVGWTGKAEWVELRLRQHDVPATSVASTRPGTADDEAQIKRTESCPRCGVALAPECVGRLPRP